LNLDQSARKYGFQWHRARAGRIFLSSLWNLHGLLCCTDWPASQKDWQHSSAMGPVIRRP